MCIAISKPKGIKLHEFVYRNSFERNDHGAGFAYVKDGKLVIRKGIRTVETFLKEVQALEAEHDMIIHCRKLSAGDHSDSNLHPFHAKSDLFPEFEFAIIHNGTLRWRTSKTRSDTSFFVEDVLQPLLDRDPYFFEFPYDIGMMNAYIGGDNKMAIMRYNAKANETDVFILNEGNGIEYNGCWFSNLSFTDDVGRYIIDSDRQRINKWVPKLYIEPPPAPPAVPYVYQHGGGSWPDDRDYLPGMAGREDTDKEGVGTMMLGTGDWGRDPIYGWYSKDPNYKGTTRTLKDYQAWKAKQVTAGGFSKDGKLPDPMPYLSNKEMKMARRECTKVVRCFYPDFDFQGLSTPEIAEWARCEMRNVEEFKGKSNEQLMHMILHGDFEPAASSPGE